MSEKLILLLFLCFCALRTLPQDRIITASGDTIDCLILSENKKMLRYEINHKGLKSTGEIKKSEIGSYQRTTFFPINEGKTDSNSKTNERIRLSINAGYGRLIASSEFAEKQLTQNGITTAEIAKKYYDSFKNSFLFNSSVHYRILQRANLDYWIGLDHTFSQNRSSMTGKFDIGDGIHWYMADYSETVFTNFYALSLIECLKLGRNGRFDLNVKIDAGLVTYRNQAMLGSPILIAGLAPGLKMGFSPSYRLTKNISFIIGASTFLSSIREISADNGSIKQKIKLEKELRENLSRFELMAGISIKL